jgi:hypothetical protein
VPKRVIEAAVDTTRMTNGQKPAWRLPKVDVLLKT